MLALVYSSLKWDGEEILILSFYWNFGRSNAKGQMILEGILSDSEPAGN